MHMMTLACHCALWLVIHKFCHEHPDGCVEDVLVALADVLGDILIFKPREINRDIEERITFGERITSGGTK